MIEILNPGWHTSIQDQGRMGLQEYGIPYSGAMDMNSFNWANKLLNNSLNAALLEMTIKGPKLKFPWQRGNAKDQRQSTCEGILD